MKNWYITGTYEYVTVQRLVISASCNETWSYKARYLGIKKIFLYFNVPLLDTCLQNISEVRDLGFEPTSLGLPSKRDTTGLPLP
ncbi:unnamed protein product, partial [Brenthis ino]